MLARRIKRRDLLGAGIAVATSPFLIHCAPQAVNTSVSPPIQHTELNPWGVNTFLHQDAELWRKQKTLEMAAQAGIGWIKQHFPWSDIEQSAKGNFTDPFWRTDAWDKYDQIVDLAQDHNLKLIARIDRPPKWAQTEVSTPTSPPTDLADFADFIFKVVSRYRGRVRHYQIWNEPNLSHEWGGQRPDPESYARLLSAAHKAAKQADPEVLILNAPLAATNENSFRAMNELDFLERLYASGAADFFDIHSANAFGLQHPPEDPPRPDVLNFRRVELSRAIMEENGDVNKPIWFNEYGWNASPKSLPEHVLTWSRVSESDQAEWTVRGIEYARNNWPWAGVICIWFFRRQYNDVGPENPEYYFRMVDPDFTPRPIYKAVQKAATRT